MFPIVFDAIEQWLLALTKGTKLMSNGNTATQLVPDSYAYPTMEEYHRPFNEPAPIYTAEDMSAMFKQLLTAFKALPEMGETLKRMEEDIENLKRQRDGYEASERTLKDELDRERQNNSDLRANYASLEESRDHWQQVANGFEQERDALRGRVAELEAKVTELNDRVERMDDGWKATVADRDRFAAERDDARSHCTTLEADCRSYNADLTTATDKLTRLREVLLS